MLLKIPWSYKDGELIKSKDEQSYTVAKLRFQKCIGMMMS